MKVSVLEGRPVCPNNESESLQIVEIKKLSVGKTFESKESQNRLIFYMQGGLELACSMTKKYIMRDNDFVFVPSNEKVKIQAYQDAEFMVFRIHKQISLSQYYKLEKFKGYKEFKLQAFKCHDLLSPYLQQLKSHIDKGLTNEYFFNLKLDELLLSLKWFYTKEQLAELFATQLNLDNSFHDYIIKNARNFHSVSELAESMNYSISGFDKKFKRVFGVSGYKWMQQQKAKEILQAICFEHRTFKEIAYSFEFASESYFYEFCKSQFGKTPGQLRRNA